jgi:hypothetical protein
MFARDLMPIGLMVRLFGSDEFLEACFIKNWHAELFGLIEFRAGICAYHYVASLFAYRGDYFAAVGYYQFAGFLAGAICQAACEDEGLAG